jgi:biotin carboxyl carrier protein
MALTDAKLMLSDAQALATSSAATVSSTNIIDLGAASPNVGRGTPIWAHVRIGTACAGSTSTTLAVYLQHCATSTGTYTTLHSYSATSIANYTAGLKVIEAPLPGTVHRYVKAIYVNAGSSITAGTADAWLDMTELESL